MPGAPPDRRERPRLARVARRSAATPGPYAAWRDASAIAVYDHREQELCTYGEYGAFADDEGIDERLRADAPDALGEKYVEDLDI
jgi:hypothetical protein